VSADQSRLVGYLNFQRYHVLGILDGLSEEQLRQPVLPSGWSCLGLVKHLSLGVEHYWFRCVMGGESLNFFSDHDLDGNRDWLLVPDDSFASIVALYREETAESNRVIAGLAMNAPPAQRDDWWGEEEFLDLEDVVLHVLAETATHAGHLDAVRELLDGRQWLAPGS